MNETVELSWESEQKGLQTWAWFYEMGRNMPRVEGSIPLQILLLFRVLMLHIIPLVLSVVQLRNQWAEMKGY